MDVMTVKSLDREQPRRATRSAERRIVGGVAAGLADHLGVDVGWVRAAFLISTGMLLDPVGLLTDPRTLLFGGAFAVATVLWTDVETTLSFTRWNSPGWELGEVGWCAWAVLRGAGCRSSVSMRTADRCCFITTSPVCSARISRSTVYKPWASTANRNRLSPLKRWPRATCGSTSGFSSAARLTEPVTSTAFGVPASMTRTL